MSHPGGSGKQPGKQAGIRGFFSTSGAAGAAPVPPAPPGVCKLLLKQRLPSGADASTAGEAIEAGEELYSSSDEAGAVLVGGLSLGVSADDQITDEDMRLLGFRT